MKRLMLAALAGALTVAMSLAPAQAADLVYVSGAGEQFRGYTMPVLVIVEGDTVAYRNFDIQGHNVVATVKGPDQAWCTQFPFNYPSGQCPLFSSKLIGLNGSSPIFGIENIRVPQGETSVSYRFYCQPHANTMVGTLVVVKAPLT